ncbi:Fimbrial assembly protein (PilN) [Tepidimonas sediminis]|uniref:Fimbrial assembly protein (PilN) n=1 Tax=Tepidimonas sediminis TaxID=2588941 RepID=A0A554WPZ9_9BURK|nr:PilN domain-containing protein [Tepidimonas sediminis]TSE25645.1 Fimbrial assembly protein (PilN) [Tepidimonas sediminis]
MIAINLLPHREWARKRRREAFYVQLGLAVLGGALVAGAIYAVYEARIGVQDARNRLLQQEIAKLDQQIKEIATLQEELEALKARQDAVESLQADRNLPVHLLNELVRQLPDGVALRSIKQEGTTIAINGVAQSQERVSELLRNLGGGSPWLKQPQLIEIVATTMNLNPGGQRRVFNFSLRVTQAKGEVAAPAARPATPPAGAT